jgi:hypothetical protein
VEHPVERIAGEIGFGSPTSLQDLFKRLVGTSLRDYRRTFGGSPARCPCDLSCAADGECKQKVLPQPLNLVVRSIPRTPICRRGLGKRPIQLDGTI